MPTLEHSIIAVALLFFMLPSRRIKKERLINMELGITQFSFTIPNGYQMLQPKYTLGMQICVRILNGKPKLISLL